ncbi:orf 49 [Ateline gammaherpesvirus 3]|uniref:Orf 49 n=1 Tax=Ateline herpesvirus 3 TaxID=85618 RepID=Q9YTL6_ATHV3|nr:orf 49 [Ateline gammaherpesvirus 3]AAC95574.1 orf 49 [Ateline gammaherpesvirus 3]
MSRLYQPQRYSLISDLHKNYHYVDINVIKAELKNVKLDTVVTKFSQPATHLERGDFLLRMCQLLMIHREEEQEIINKAKSNIIYFMNEILNTEYGEVKELAKNILCDVEIPKPNCELSAYLATTIPKLIVLKYPTHFRVCEEITPNGRWCLRNLLGIEPYYKYISDTVLLDPEISLGSVHAFSRLSKCLFWCESFMNKVYPSTAFNSSINQVVLWSTMFYLYSIAHYNEYVNESIGFTEALLKQEVTAFYNWCLEQEDYEADRMAKFIQFSANQITLTSTHTDLQGMAEYMYSYKKCFINRRFD